MAKAKDTLRLSDGILEDGMYEKLVLRDTQICSLLDNVESRFRKIKKSYANNQTILLFMNGRVDKFAFQLAEKVLEETEKELFVLYSEVESLKSLRENIKDVLSSVDKSRNSEEKILKLEQFMSRRNEGTSKINSSQLLYFEELARVKEQARLLEHSATALLELKVGS